MKGMNVKAMKTVDRMARASEPLVAFAMTATMAASSRSSSRPTGAPKICR
jgi:hypothetical protein